MILDGVRHCARTKCSCQTGNGGGVSNTCAVIHVVRFEHAPRHLLEEIDILIRGTRARKRRQRLAAVGIAQLGEPTRHQVERFVPGSRPELAGLGDFSPAACGCGRGSRRNREACERPFTHSRPSLDGPSAACTSTIWSPFTTRSSWQPTPQCGQVVRTVWVSHSRYSPRRFSTRAPVGHACAQLPQLSQMVASQFGPNSARMVVRTPRLPVCSTWLPAALLHAPTQRWQAMHRLGSKRRNGLEFSSRLARLRNGEGGAERPPRAPRPAARRRRSSRS